MNYSKLYDEEFKKRYGAYDTPSYIVDLMIRLTKIKNFSGLKVLEPACGLAPFSYAISRIKGKWDDIIGVEVDPDIASIVKQRYPEFNVRVGDYLLTDFQEKFDLVIGNPPYGIIGSESHYAISVFKQNKEIYKERFETWFGKYNIYGLFIEKGIKDLKEDGILCFIIPATWMILDEFKKLREFLAYSGRLEVYYLGKGIFEGLNVTTVILIVRRGRKGLELYDASDGQITLNYSKNEYSGEIITFKTKLTEDLENKSCAKLGDLFEIKISPRSPEIKSTQFLLREKVNGAIPLLNGKNLTRNGIDYETCYSGYYIKPEDIGRLRKFFLKDRVVVGHTKGGKLIAAIDHKHYAWTGDVYHLIPKIGLYNWLSTKSFSLEELNHILNSKIMDCYMKDKYREITPHTTKTQLNLLPLMSLDELKALEKSL
ncbi:MAG: TaqI-like C-terminal specificity domain-containing protein [Candidatus Bathyarchaeia archaeon]